MAKAKLLIQPVRQTNAGTPAQEFSWLQAESVLPPLESAAVPHEYAVTGLVSIGRAKDNRLRLPDERIADYHATVEEHGGQFLVAKISNKADILLNGAPLTAKTPLQHGDVLTLAEAYILRLQIEQPANAATTTPYQAAQTAPVTPATSETTAAAINPTISAVTAPAGASAASAAHASLPVWVAPVVIILTLLLVFGGGWLAYQYVGESNDCRELQISNPLGGTVFSEMVAIQVRGDKAGCSGQVRFHVNDQEFSSASGKFFEAALDPVQLGLAPGEHVVTIDSPNKLKSTPRPVRLIYRPPGAPSDAPPPGVANLSLEDIKSMASNLARGIAANGALIQFEDPQFLEQIRAMSAVYQQRYTEAVYAQAKMQAASIRKASDGLYNPALGMVLAFSRSAFDTGASASGCGVAPDGTGLYRLPRSVMTQKATLKLTEADVALSHLKELLSSIGTDSDILYAIACFGENNARVGKLGADIPDPQARHNFWVNAGALSPEEQQRVICFLAAGIVAENPQKFNLTTPPLIRLYN